MITPYNIGKIIGVVLFILALRYLFKWLTKKTDKIQEKRQAEFERSLKK